MYDIIVIGAGPAGSSAALFAAKANKKTLVIDNDKSLTKKAWIENHYGITAISGPDLIALGKEQAVNQGAEMIQDQVINIVKTDEGFEVVTETGKAEGKQIILATGVGLELAEKIGVNTKPGTEPRIKAVIEVDSDGRTTIDGIWAAGTVAGVSVHTIITAGHGASVAINVITQLNGERYVDHDLIKA